MAPQGWRILLMIAAGVCCAVAATAAISATFTSLRDPTQPPAAVAAPGSVRNPLDAFRPQHLVIVGGERYLVWNGRRYRAGESISGGQIERITETEVWLRGSDGLRKLPLFSGIEKRPPNSANATNAPNAGNVAKATTTTNTSGQPAGKKGQIK